MARNNVTVHGMGDEPSWFNGLRSKNAEARGSDVSAAGEVLDLRGSIFSSFILHPSLALPAKLAGLTYRPSRECVVNQIIVAREGS
jgi:hypothetical protein